MPNNINRHVRKVSLGTHITLPMLSMFMLALTGCASSVVPNYYTLAPRVTAVQGTSLRVIEVLPVSLPDRLDRPSIMVNTEQGHSKILDNDRWTSPLSAELHDSLSSGLQQQLGAVDRYSSGLPSINTVYRIGVNFSRFDIVKANTAQNNSEIVVEATWIIKPIEPAQTTTTKLQNHRPLSCRMTFNQPIANKAEVPDMVSASKVALGRVTTAISDTVFASEKGTLQVKYAVCS